MRPPAAPVLALAALLAAGCAAPSDAPAPRTPSDAEVEQYNAHAAEGERIVCRRETPVGSYIPRRMCRYARDIAEASDVHRRELRRALRE